MLARNEEGKKMKRKRNIISNLILTLFAVFNLQAVY